MINLPDDIEQSDLDGISDYINRNFYNVTWNQMLKSGILNVRQDIGRRIEQFDQVVELIQELLLGESTADIYLGGTARILVQPEFQDVNRVRSILKLLDHREAMLSLLGE